MSEPTRRLYLDLDGVMADFDAHFPATFGLDHRGMADDEMWKSINAHPSYFRDMPPCAGAIEFFRSIEHLRPIILTACPRTNYQHVARQKRAWVREHLSEHVTVLPVMGGRNKPLFMQEPGDVLIDDWSKNTEAWEEAGGVAILHRDFVSTAEALLSLFQCVPEERAQALASEPVEILYTNWRGETAVRRIEPISSRQTYVTFWFGSNRWHPKPQWLLSATDAETGAERCFALAGIHAWGREAVVAALASHSLDAGEGLTLATLHAANVARQAEWCPDQVPDLSFRGNELAGEAGEASEALILHAAELGRLAGRASNVVKKLERERYGWRGSRATKEALAEELADVVICADLCSITADIDLPAAVLAKFNSTSEKQGLRTMLTAASTSSPLDAERLREALQDAAVWRESQDKALSKQPQTADGLWRRSEHQEQAETIRNSMTACPGIYPAGDA